MKKTTFLKALTLASVLAYTLPCFADKNDDLVKACQQGDIDNVKKIVDGGANVNFVNATGGTPLSSAILWPEIEKFLLSKKADPNNGKQLALQVAATYGAAETMKLLLDAGADPNKGTELNVGNIYDKMIADEEAKEKPDKARIKIYHTMADKAKSTPIYTYPLPTAVQMTNNKACIEMLLAKGAKIDKTMTGNLFMDYATTAATIEKRLAKNKEVADNLEKAGLKVPDWFRNLDPATQASPDEIVKILLKSGAAINGTNPRLTPLLFCIQRDGPLKADEEVVMAFLTNGAKFDMDETNHGKFMTPVLRMAQLGYNQALGYMLDHGCDQNAKYKLKIDATGEDLEDVTPLMYAAESGKLETVKMLLKRGANYKTQAHGLLVDKVERCRNKVKSKNVIYFAIESGNLELVKYLWEDIKYDWNMNRLEFEPITDIRTSGNMTVTTAYAACHNGFTGEGPAQWASTKNFADINAYIKSK